MQNIGGVFDGVSKKRFNLKIKIKKDTPGDKTLCGRENYAKVKVILHFFINGHRIWQVHSLDSFADKE